MGAQYKSDISPTEAWKFLGDAKDSVLVDIRTKNEWIFVGVPDLSSIGKEVILKEWRVSSDMSINPNFIEDLKAEIKDKSCSILFLCRSGGRSAEAATLMTENGYENCYNIESGFEGELDQESHRSSKNGWKFDKLPWRQG